MSRGCLTVCVQGVFFFFTMELLQGIQYWFIADDINDISNCASIINKILTVLGYAHICLQVRGSAQAVAVVAPPRCGHDVSVLLLLLPPSWCSACACVCSCLTPARPRLLLLPPPQPYFCHVINSSLVRSLGVHAVGCACVGMGVCVRVRACVRV